MGCQCVCVCVCVCVSVCVKGWPLSAGSDGGGGMHAPPCSKPLGRAVPMRFKCPAQPHCIYPCAGTQPSSTRLRPTSNHLRPGPGPALHRSHLYPALSMLGCVLNWYPGLAPPASTTRTNASASLWICGAARHQEQICLRTRQLCLLGACSSTQIASGKRSAATAQRRAGGRQRSARAGRDPCSRQTANINTPPAEPRPHPHPLPAGSWCPAPRSSPRRRPYSARS